MNAVGVRQAVLVLAFALLAYGSVSEHWFVDTSPPFVVHEGVMSSEICGPDVGRGGDALEQYGRAQETGIQPPPPRWTCERTFHAPLVADIHKLNAFVLWWLVELVCLVAGLASAVLLAFALIGRRRSPRALRVSSAVALASAIVTIGMAVATGAYSLSNIGGGAAAFVAGALLAVWSPRAPTAQ